MSMGNVLVLLGAAAALVLTVAGLALIIHARSLAKTLLVPGLALAATAAIGPDLMASARGLGPLDMLAAASVLAAIPAFASGRSKLGLSLTWPAISRWALWPTLEPYFWANWMLVILIAAPFTVFILIWFLQRILTPIYGGRAASHVTGEYLVRTIDGAGNLLGILIAAPFRLILRMLGRP
jgi:hypothetical protein